MDFKGERVDAHNVWPKKIEFWAEAKFQQKLDVARIFAPFQPIKLGRNDDADYQRCIGHLIDGLDALPQRPDYFFDHCFRVIDLSQKLVAPKKGIRGVMERLPGRLIKLDANSWEQIVDAIGLAIPKVTADFFAKRLLESFHGQENHQVQLKDRAEEAMGKDFYDAYCKKFLYGENKKLLPNFKSNLGSAGSLLRLYLSGKPGTRKKKASVAALDLRSNPISAVTRMKVLLSLLLFTVRNERAHGTVLSPFRSSKASVERYGSYYFLMLVSYVFALGTLSLRFPSKGIASPDILVGCIENLTLQSDFFGPVKKTN